MQSNKSLDFLSYVEVTDHRTLSPINDIEIKWALSNNAPTPTHSHSPPSTPPTQNIFPPTPTHPKYLPTYSHLPKIMSHPPPPTQNNVPLTPTHHYLPKIMPHTHPHSTTLTQNNVSPTETILSPARLVAKRKAKKRLWNTSNTWSKIGQIEGIFLRIN